MGVSPFYKSEFEFYSSYSPFKRVNTSTLESESLLKKGTQMKRVNVIMVNEGVFNLKKGVSLQIGLQDRLL